MEDKTIILDHQQILHKVKRISFEILENNLDANSIHLGGLNKRGAIVSDLIKSHLETICGKKIISFNIGFPNEDKGDYTAEVTGFSPVSAEDSIIVIDDVLNSGKTLANALIPFIPMNPKNLDVAVLMERSHKRFPVHADYVGMSLATTLQEHVYFDATDLNNLSVYLK